jgi:hypothetical protein
VRVPASDDRTLVARSECRDHPRRTPPTLPPDTRTRARAHRHSHKTHTDVHTHARTHTHTHTRARARAHARTHIHKQAPVANVFKGIRGGRCFAQYLGRLSNGKVTASFSSVMEEALRLQAEVRPPTRVVLVCLVARRRK